MPAAWIAPLLLGTAVAAPGHAAAGPLVLSAQERAGKQIYLEGTSPSGGEITAVLGRDTAPLPGTALACGGCHGADGLGRPEGGVVPSELTWSSLARPWGHAHPNGRSHPPYDARGLERAIAEGRDPAGNRLDPAMPRYRMPPGDRAALIAYLKVIEEDLDPGIGPDELRIGTVLPLTGRLGEVGRAIRPILEGAFEDLNASGGIHGRRLVLEVAGYDGDRENGVASAEQLLARRPVLALVSAFTPGAEDELASLAARQRTPLVGPFQPAGGPPGAPGPWLFQLLPGLVEQARALAEYAARDLRQRDPEAAVVAPARTGLDGAVGAALAQLRRRGWSRAEAVRYEPGAAAGLAARLRQHGAEVLLFLGEDADLEVLGREAGALAWAPVLLAPGPLAARAASRLPAAFQGRVYLAYPSLPPDARSGAGAALLRLRKRAGIADANAAAQVSAYAAAQVLAEALRRIGRQLSRERLVGGLEGLYGFETGLTPPLRFGPGRHLGAPGAYVVAVDLETRAFRQVAPWLALD